MKLMKCSPSSYFAIILYTYSLLFSSSLIFCCWCFVAFISEKKG